MNCLKWLLTGLIILAILSTPMRVYASATPTPTFSTKYDISIITIEIPTQTGALTIAGWTSPGAVVTYVKNAQVIGTTLACPLGNPSICTGPNAWGFFSKTFTGLQPDIYAIGVYAIDTSNPLMSTNTVIRVFNVFEGQSSVPDPMTLPPTLKVDKPVMKRPELQTVRGMGRPNSKVSIFFDTNNPFPLDPDIDVNGNYSATNPVIQHLGTRYVKALVQAPGGAISEGSQVIPFTVELSADLNMDGAVGIADFSILMFNYEQLPPSFWAADINDNGAVDISDFSIMMYYWSEPL